ncbi:MAG TPA: hypothetical protein VG166_09160 [Caulobacteraceae bacterium]|nr:hypothetical protein [Caulobacteraceae bacterium]
MIFQHAPWWDETQALLIARAPFADLFGNLKYEGHGALWYVWLGLVDRLTGAAPWSLAMAQVPIAIAIQALIWLRSPFSLIVKALVALSYFFVFEYAIQARDYGLTVIFIFGAVVWRGSLWSWIALALAANTCATGVLAAVAVGVLLFIRKPDWRGVAILAVGLALAAATALPHPADFVPNDKAHPGAGSVVRTVRTMSGLVVPAIPSWPYRWESHPPGWWGWWIGLLTLPLGWWLFRLRSSRLVFAGLWGGVAAFSIAIYPLYPHHAGMIVVFAVAALWLEQAEGLAPNLVAKAWLGLLVLCGAPFWLSATAAPFSNNRAIAAWVRQRGLDHETWGAWPRSAGERITWATGRPTIDLDGMCADTFTKWNHLGVVGQPGTDGRLAASGVRWFITEAPLTGATPMAYFPATRGHDYSAWIYRYDGPTASRPPGRCP